MSYSSFYSKCSVMPHKVLFKNDLESLNCHGKLKLEKY